MTIHGHHVAKLMGPAALFFMFVSVVLAIAADARFKRWLAAAGRRPNPSQMNDYRAFARSTKPELPTPVRQLVAFLETVSVGCMLVALLLIAL